MNVKDLTDEEKSLMLARQVWREVWLTNSQDHVTGFLFYDDAASSLPIWTYMADTKDGGFYNPVNMALAWEVRRWFIGHIEKDRDAHEMTDPNPRMFDQWYFWQMGRAASGKKRIDEMPAADAQRAWLDKILELAIEAGLIPLP